MKQKGFGTVQILVAVVILAVAGLAYSGKLPLLSQTGSPTLEVSQSGETINWKAYTNKVLSYTLKTPPDWKVSEELFIGTPGEVVIIPPEEINTEAYRTEIAITSPQTPIRYSLDTQQEFDEWVAKEPSGGQNQRLYKVSDRLIDDIKAVEFVSRALPGDQTEAFYSTVVWFRKDGSNYYIEFGGQEEIVKRHTNTWNTILSTFQFENQANTKASSSAKKLNYSLPSGWKTIKDQNGELEVGYDPNETQMGTVKDKYIDLIKTRCYGPDQGYNISVAVGSYDGGSRHQAIYKKLGISTLAKEDRSTDYHEKEYSYNGWSCLVLYGVQVSQINPNQGICVVNNSQAIYFSTSSSNDETTEGVLTTIKFI